MTFPDFFFEKKAWKSGFRYVAGADEVGRGCLAGPVVAGCVVFKKEILPPEGIYVNDSKKLTLKRKMKADIWIRKNALSWGIGNTSAAEINRIGILKATKSAFRKAIKDCNRRLYGQIDFLLIDAFYLSHTKGLKKKNQSAIKGGDSKSFSIAASSIVAKVYRDNLMTGLSKKDEYKKYKWQKNKGYGTKEHGRAVSRYGITKHHRKLFVETFLKNLKRKKN